jgi:hypothetical protein
MGNPARLIASLLHLGGGVELRDGALHLEGPEESEALVNKVAEHKVEVFTFLRSLQNISGRPYATCYLCSRFRAAVNSPNPREALGRCLHRNVTRYALQRPCRDFTFREGLCAFGHSRADHGLEQQEEFKRLCSLVSASVSRVAEIYPEGGYDQARKTGLLVKLQTLEHAIDEACKALDEPRLLGALEAWEKTWLGIRDMMARQRQNKAPEPIEATA